MSTTTTARRSETSWAGPVTSFSDQVVFQVNHRNLRPKRNAFWKLKWLWRKSFDDVIRILDTFSACCIQIKGSILLASVFNTIEKCFYLIKFFLKCLICWLFTILLFISYFPWRKNFQTLLVITSPLSVLYSASLLRFSVLHYEYFIHKTHSANINRLFSLQHQLFESVFYLHLRFWILLFL